MTAHLPRKFDPLLRCSGKARGHRPRLQLTEYRLNWNSSASGVLNEGGLTPRAPGGGKRGAKDAIAIRDNGGAAAQLAFAAPFVLSTTTRPAFMTQRTFSLFETAVMLASGSPSTATMSA